MVLTPIGPLIFLLHRNFTKASSDKTEVSDLILVHHFNDKKNFFKIFIYYFFILTINAYSNEKIVYVDMNYLLKIQKLEHHN